MTINKTCIILLFALAVSSSIQVFAQTGTKKLIIAPKGKYKVTILPEFYQYTPIKKGDTTFSFECFDRNDKKMNLDSGFNINNAEEIFILKSYYQFPYKPGAIISPPYLSMKIFTFERTSKNTWIGNDLNNKEKTGIKEHMNTIVRSDTVTINDPATGGKQNIIHKYYKVDLGPATEVPEGHHGH